MRALARVDIGDREDVRLALRTALKVEHQAWPLFDHVFAESWTSRGAPAKKTTPPPRPPRQRAPRPWPGHDNPLATLARRLEAQTRTHPSGAEAEAGRPGYSPRAQLRRKSFEACTPDELAAMERALKRLARQAAVRRSRRWIPAPCGPRLDLRRSLRRALATDGEIVKPARKERSIDLPHLVVLCDTSGSMDPHARFLLAFILSLRKVAPGTRIFAFNTSLAHLTPWITAANVTATLARLAAEVPDWSGGTRIGECLAHFVDDYLRQTVRRDTSVLIFSDGLDRGDRDRLARAMLAIRRRAHRVYWLNPLLGDARYRPEARGMKVALPHVDALLPAHNMESLDSLLQIIKRPSRNAPAGR